MYQKTLRQMSNLDMAPGRKLRVHNLIDRIAPFYPNWADGRADVALARPAASHIQGQTLA